MDNWAAGEYGKKEPILAPYHSRMATIELIEEEGHLSEVSDVSLNQILIKKPRKL
jgi:hypothetical protein